MWDNMQLAVFGVLFVILLICAIRIVRMSPEITIYSADRSASKALHRGKIVYGRRNFAEDGYEWWQSRSYKIMAIGKDNRITLAPVGGGATLLAWPAELSITPMPIGYRS